MWYQKICGFRGTHGTHSNDATAHRCCVRWSRWTLDNSGCISSGSVYILFYPFLGVMPHRVNATVRPVGLEFIVTRLVRPVITAKIVKRNASAKMEQLATISPVRLLKDSYRNGRNTASLQFWKYETSRDIKKLLSKFEINRLNGFCVIQESLDIGNRIAPYV